MKTLPPLILAALLGACAAPLPPEEQALVYRSDACVNPALTRKPVWCPAPKDPLALPVERITNPQGSIVNGRWVR